MRKRKYMLYARVSPKGTRWSGTETSCRAQLKECREYVLARDPDAEFEEIVDEYRSGKNLRRPGIQEIIARMGEDWECLVVWHLDRLTRSLADSVPFFKLLNTHNKGLMSVRQEIDMYTAGGRLMLNMFIVCAQYEREMTSERVKMKHRAVRKEGRLPNGACPMGYERVPGKKGEIRPNEDAKIVRAVYRKYLDGELTTRWAKEISGGRIKGYTTLAEMLRRRTYLGEAEYEGKIYKGNWEAIIDRETWEAVQKKLSGNRKRGAQVREGAQKYPYLLAGKIKCHCGAAMSPGVHGTTGGKRYHYYTCGKCGEAIRAEIIEGAVMKEIEGVLLAGAELEEAFGRYREAVKREKAAKMPRMKELEERKEEAEKKLERIDEAFLGGLVTAENKEYWNAKLAEARKEKEEIEEEIAEWSAVGDVEQVEKEFEQARSEIQSITHAYDPEHRDPAKARKLVEGYVKEVRCVRRGEFIVTLFVSKTPPDGCRQQSIGATLSASSKQASIEWKHVWGFWTTPRRFAPFVSSLREAQASRSPVALRA